MVGLPDGEKNGDICNGLDTILACDRQTDRRTDILSRHIRAMHTRRAVKIVLGLARTKIVRELSLQMTAVIVAAISCSDDSTATAYTLAV